MAVTSAPVLRRARAQALARPRVAVPVGLGVAAALSVLLRVEHLDVGFWIDEGLSVGIADRPLTEIPGTLRLDGSPPLYYMLLWAWMRVLGDSSETAVRALSLVFATAAIPVAWALVRPLFGTRAAWFAALLTAVAPFLTEYAQEARMYSLAVLLGIVASACFVAAFALGRGRRWTLGFAAAMTALLYTHNWAIFLGAALTIAWVVLVETAEAAERRAVVRDGLLSAAVIAVAYAPWLPSLLFQAAHTGAPWAQAPPVEALGDAFEKLLGDGARWTLLLGAGVGLIALLRGAPRRWSGEARAAVALALAGPGTIVVAWLISQSEPAWAGRYLAVALPPLLLLGALGLARAGRVTGLAALALTLALMATEDVPSLKSNVREVAESVAPGLASGDLLVSTQPEQIPVLHHYLADVHGLRWATLTGPVADLGVTDWRDGARRLEATDPRRDLVPLLDAVGRGGRVVLVQPIIFTLDRWRAPWTAAVRRKSTAWEQFVLADPRFRVVDVVPENPQPRPPNPVRATVFVRVR